MKKLLVISLLIAGLLCIPCRVFSDQTVLNDTGSGSSEWKAHSTTSNASTLTLTKAASTTKRWALPDFSAGGSQNGHVDVSINGTEVWTLYFVAGTSTGQKVVLNCDTNQTVSITVTLETSGSIAINIRGTEW